MPDTADDLLDVRDLSLSFGGLQVLSQVRLRVWRGAIHGLVGPNGAGKTSAFNCISGLYRPSAGTIDLDGVELTRKRPAQLAGLGVARTFQHPSLDPDATVLQNVLVGAHPGLRGNAVTSALRCPAVRRDERDARRRAVELLDYAGLSESTGLRPGALPYGSQKRVELVRALMGRPRLLMLDEPAGGLSHGEVDELGGLIRRIRDDFDVSVLLVEHHMGLVGAITDVVDALVEGRNVTTGPAAMVQTHPAVVDAYLGVPA